MRKTKPVGSGFTLIELLVVIAVLGILSAVVLVAINPAERLRSARDSGAKSDIGQIATALEAYYTDNNGAYPITQTGLAIPATLTSGGYLKSIPTPPSGSGSDDSAHYNYAAFDSSGGDCTTGETCSEFELWYDLESSSATGDWCYQSANGTASDVGGTVCAQGS